MITCMEMKSFILKYASKIMFYDVNIACYQIRTLKGKNRIEIRLLKYFLFSAREEMTILTKIKEMPKTV